MKKTKIDKKMKAKGRYNYKKTKRKKARHKNNPKL